MKNLFSIIFFSLFVYVNGLYAQDPAIYKNDSCENKIIPKYVGCGHPDYEISLCGQHILKSVLIYDRWANALIEYTGEQFKWDHQDKNGNRIKEGVYYFVITTIGPQGTEKVTNGNFTYVP